MPRCIVYKNFHFHLNEYGNFIEATDFDSLWNVALRFALAIPNELLATSGAGRLGRLAWWTPRKIAYLVVSFFCCRFFAADLHSGNVTFRLANSFSVVPFTLTGACWCARGWCANWAPKCIDNI